MCRTHFHTLQLPDRVPFAHYPTQVPGVPVYGVAIPTVLGLRSVLNAVGANRGGLKGWLGQVAAAWWEALPRGLGSCGARTGLPRPGCATKHTKPSGMVSSTGPQRAKLVAGPLPAVSRSALYFAMCCAPATRRAQGVLAEPAGGAAGVHQW